MWKPLISTRNVIYVFIHLHKTLFKKDWRQHLRTKLLRHRMWRFTLTATSKISPLRPQGSIMAACPHRPRLEQETAVLAVAGCRKISIPACYCHLQGTGWFSASCRMPAAGRKSQLWVKAPSSINARTASSSFPSQVSKRDGAQPCVFRSGREQRLFYIASSPTSNNFSIYSLTRKLQNTDCLYKIGDLQDGWIQNIGKFIRRFTNPPRRKFCS